MTSTKHSLDATATLLRCELAPGVFSGERTAHYRGAEHLVPLAMCVDDKGAPHRGGAEVTTGAVRVHSYPAGENSESEGYTVVLPDLSRIDGVPGWDLLTWSEPHATPLQPQPGAYFDAQGCPVVSEELLFDEDDYARPGPLEEADRFVDTHPRSPAAHLWWAHEMGQHTKGYGCPRLMYLRSLPRV
jgi:hypothetical protein